jgi:hypothetical protein
MSENDEVKGLQRMTLAAVMVLAWRLHDHELFLGQGGALWVRDRRKVPFREWPAPQFPSVHPSNEDIAFVLRWVQETSDKITIATMLEELDPDRRNNTEPEEDSQ